MAELADALDLGSVTTVEFYSCHCQAGKKRREIKYAGMAKLADAPDLGSGGEIHAGSIPVTRTSIGSEKFCACAAPFLEKVLVDVGMRNIITIQHT